MCKKRLILHMFSLAAILLIAVPLITTPVFADVEEQNIWAIAIGISQYPFLVEECNGECVLENVQDVSFAANNARAFYNFLCNLGQEEHSKLLIDEQATKSDIYYGIKWLAEHADANDTVIMYFSGLGLAPASLLELNVPSYTLDSRAGYIAPYESGSPLSTEIDNEIPYLYRTWYRDRNYDIAAAELSLWMDMLITPKVLLIFDMNYAGSLGNELSDFNRVIMMSSRDNEHSLECKELQHGIFTNYILQGLHDPAAAELNNDYQLSAEELFNYAQTMTCNEKTACNGTEPSSYMRQHPVIADFFPGSFNLLYSSVFTTEAILPAGTIILTVDGQEYSIDELPLSRNWRAGSLHEISVAQQIDLGQGNRAIFTSWDDGYKNPVRTISAGGEYRPVYKMQYYLGINSRYGQPQGSGWYDSNSYAPLFIKQVDGVLIRRHFLGWTSDYTGSEAATRITMDSAKTVRAEWEKDFSRIFILSGCLILLAAIAMILVKRGKKQLHH